MRSARTLVACLGRSNGSKSVAGSTVEARGVTGRTITLMLYLVVLLLYTCYSASIVVLLQSTTNPINHYRDLVGSTIKAGVTDAPHVLRYIGVSAGAAPCDNRAIPSKKLSRGIK